ncbi:sensor domain-containing diguanylate cyclase [Vibrio hippocampi]|uniref:diguanylate cyclase n=1 Tax=Vibrio hippocampi TaxID=654686 RepID=A0ABM8ZHW4_9VIBR|nr:sensor domain-containing diguanylate cyclase [Vibrio hippocampi]CAH0525927.1 hypothetical protein VHP8226_01409 [Vibrio hippocampi]
MVTRVNLEDRGVKRYSLTVFVCGIMFTVLILHLVSIGQKQTTQNNVEFFIDRQVESLETLVNNDISFIGAGASFFQATNPPAWVHFSTFAQPLIANSKSLVAMQWMKTVYPEQITDYVAKMRTRFPGYSIKTMPEFGVIKQGYVGDGNKAIYLISDTFPINKANVETLGFYPSNPKITQLIDAAKSTGLPAISGRTVLLQDRAVEGQPQRGFLAFYPVFKSGSQTLQGVVVGAIRSTVYFDNMVTHTSWGQDIGVRVLDIALSDPSNTILYQNSHWDSNQGQVTEVTMKFYNHDWTLQFKQDHRMSDSDIFLLACIAFSGVVISLLLAYVVQLMLREQYRLAMLVSRRTRDLQYLVDRDPLTEVYNRRAFNRLAEYQIERHQCFSLVIVDIDNFKTINDQYGHVTGDAILRKVACFMRGYVSDKDTVFRLGGDEFAIISERHDYLTLGHYLSNLCRQIEHLEWPDIDHDFSCTLSIGAAIYRGEQLEQLLNRADEQLYFSKEQGRNRASVV